MFGFCPVAKHYRDGANYLNINMMMSAFFESLFWIPAIAFDFAEEGIVHHHSCAAGFVVLELDKLSVAKFLFPAGEVFWDDVGVYVDREKILRGKHATKVHRFREMLFSSVISLL